MQTKQIPEFATAHPVTSEHFTYELPPEEILAKQATTHVRKRLLAVYRGERSTILVWENY